MGRSPYDPVAMETNIVYHISMQIITDIKNISEKGEYTQSNNFSIELYRERDVLKSLEISSNHELSFEIAVRMTFTTTFFLSSF
jgi:hypothetical protein